MKKVFQAGLILFLLFSIVSCGQTANVDTELQVTEQIFEGISFNRPVDWTVTTEEAESNSILIKSNSTYHNHSVLVVSLISGIDMTAMDYAKSVFEGLENASNPKEMKFGDLSFPMVTITQNTTTYNFFFSSGPDIYFFTYANMENRIEKELEDILASLKINQVLDTPVP
ncbi:MAG: hypothetical protein R2883_07280 [Caldisericia bacterium]